MECLQSASIQDGLLEHCFQVRILLGGSKDLFKRKSSRSNRLERNTTTSTCISCNVSSKFASDSKLQNLEAHASSGQIVDMLVN